MAHDSYKRDLLFRLAEEYLYPNEKDLEKLFNYSFVNNQNYINSPEVELGIMPYEFIKNYYGYNQDYLDRLLLPYEFSGAGLVSGVKAQIPSALFIYQKYRLFTAVDVMVTNQMKDYYNSHNEPYEIILKALVKFSYTRRRKMTESEIEFMFWHFVEEFSLPGNQMTLIRQKAFDKCFKDIQNILKTTDGSPATLKIIIDKFYQSI